MTFYETLSELMDRNNVSKKQLSEILQIGKNQFKYWETKGNIPNGETLIALSDYFKCSVDYLLGRTDKPDMTINVNQTGRTIVSSPINAVNNAEKPSNEMTAELVKIFEAMSFSDKIKIMNFVLELKTKTSPDSGEE